MTWYLADAALVFAGCAVLAFAFMWLLHRFALIWRGDSSSRAPIRVLSIRLWPAIKTLPATGGESITEREVTMSDHDHHGTAAAAPRRILGIRFGKGKPRPTDPKLGGGTKVGCCGHCVGAARPGLPAGK